MGIHFLYIGKKVGFNKAKNAIGKEKRKKRDHIINCKYLNRKTKRKKCSKERKKEEEKKEGNNVLVDMVSFCYLAIFACNRF